MLLRHTIQLLDDSELHVAILRTGMIWADNIGKRNEQLAMMRDIVGWMKGGTWYVSKLEKGVIWFDATSVITGIV